MRSPSPASSRDSRRSGRKPAQQQPRGRDADFVLGALSGGGKGGGSILRVYERPEKPVPAGEVEHVHRLLQREAVDRPRPRALVLQITVPARDPVQFIGGV